METDVRRARGRPRIAVPAEVAATALRLFSSSGYDATTMDDIARACGISRPTLFRYFPSKGDIVWDRYDEGVVELRELLARADPDAGPLEVLCDLVPRLFHYDDADLDLLRTQVTIIASTPSVQGQAQLRSANWTAELASFVASRLGVTPGDLLPQVLSQCVWSTGWTALIHWAATTDPSTAASPDESLRTAFSALRSGFAAPR